MPRIAPPDPTGDSGASVEPVVGPAADDAAGDLELIRWSLSLSPEERLAVLQDFVDTFWTSEHG